MPAPGDSNAREPHGLNAPRTEAAARKLVTRLGASFPDERFEAQEPYVPVGPVRPVAAAVASVPPTPTEGTPNETLYPLDLAAHQAATSPHNNLPQPTVPQKEAGNYIARQKLAPAPVATPTPSNTPTDTPTVPAGASPGPSQEVDLSGRPPMGYLQAKKMFKGGYRLVWRGTGNPADIAGVPFTSDFKTASEARDAFATAWQSARRRSAEDAAGVAEPRSASPAVHERSDPRLRDPEMQAALRYMATQAGWAQRGGELLRDKVIGRTQWLPNEPWYAGIPERLNLAATIEAVRKAIAGDKLGAKERRVVGYMLDAFESERAFHQGQDEQEVQSALRQDEDEAEREAREERSAIMAEADLALDALPDEDIESLIARGEARLLKDDELDRFFETETVDSAGGAEEAVTGRQVAGAVQPGAEARADEDRPLLEGYTAADLAEREQASLDAERREAEDTAAALRKRQADRDREGFVLTGSDNVADELEARGQEALDLKGASKPGAKTDMPRDVPLDEESRSTLRRGPGPHAQAADERRQGEAGGPVVGRAAETHRAPR